MIVWTISSTICSFPSLGRYHTYIISASIAIFVKIWLNTFGLTLLTTAKICLRIPIRFRLGTLVALTLQRENSLKGLIMSANTRLERNKELANLASLYAQAVGLIERGKRSPQQVHALLTSFQLFKENRLLASVPKPPKDILPEPEAIQHLLSLKLSETDINRKTLTLLHKGGIEYVGELFLVDWGYSQTIKIVQEFLRSLNLTLDFEFDKFDWVPPYADKNFYWRMNQPIALFLEEEIPQKRPLSSFRSRLRWTERWTEKHHYTGELFQTLNRSWHYFCCLEKGSFRNAVRDDAKLRAGLYCPKSWTPPPDPPK